MKQQEFTINSRKETFRTTRVDPVELLALASVIDFDKYEQQKILFQFSLEHIEVNINDVWFPVKSKGVYMPLDIEEDFVALNELSYWYLTNVITKNFQKSSE